MIILCDDDWKATWYVSESSSDIIESMGEIDAQIKQHHIVAVDFETVGVEEEKINPLKDSIQAISFCVDGERSYAWKLMDDNKWLWDDLTVDAIKQFFDNLFDQSFKKVIHNFKFDAKLLYRITGKMPQVGDYSWEDTMIMAYLLDENTTWKLKSVANRYLGMDSFKYQNMVDALGGIKKAGTLDWYILGQYNAADTLLTIRLYYVLRKLIEDGGFSNLYEELYKGISCVLLETEITGFTVDTEYLRKVQAEIKERIDDRLNKIRIITGNPEFNPKSTNQVREVLIKLGLDKKIYKKKKTGICTDEKVLSKIKKYDDTGFVQMLLDNRKDATLKSTFVDGLLKRADNGILRSSFSTSKARTGRLTSSDPNFENLPRGRQIRYAFMSRDGRSILSGDYSQLEMRIEAFLSGDENMAEVYRVGGDFHSRTVIACCKLSCTEAEVKAKYKEKRDDFKEVSFGVLYGMSAYSLSQKINSTEDEAQHYIDSWFEAYPRVRSHIDYIHDFVLANEYVENIFGRKRRFPGLKKAFEQHGRFDKEVQYNLREAFNFVIQSVGAEICNLSIKRTKLRAIKEGLSILLLNQVHDEADWEVKDENVDHLSNIVHEEGENIVDGLESPIEISVVKRWGEKYP